MSYDQGQRKPSSVEKPPSDSIVESSGTDEVEHQATTITEAQSGEYLSGWQLHCLTVTLCLGIFLVNFEITVVSTSLVAITNDLGGFGRSTWMITAYLLTYTGFMVILSKLSDVFGRKRLLTVSLFIFTLFSGGCGAAQNIEQLIILRAFQGLGGSGVYSLVMVIMFEMVPPEKYPLYSVLVTALFAVSLITGPLVGGVIIVNTTWRWIFLLNVPPGCLALILLLILLPGDSCKRTPSGATEKSVTLQRLDFIGAFFMIASLLLLIVGFEQASNFNPWRSAQVIVPIVVAVPLGLAFTLYERSLTIRDGLREPVLPWRLIRSRSVGGILLGSFFIGTIFTTLVIQIPLRFQTVNRLTSFQAGLRLIPLTITFPIGAILCAVVCSKRRLPPIFILIISALIEVVALAFLSQTKLSQINWAGLYGFQAMAGIGLGLGIGATVLTIPFAIEKRDLAVATAAVIQFRMLGGAVGVALCAGVANSLVQSALRRVLPNGKVQELYDSTEAINTLSNAQAKIVQENLLRGYNIQMYILLGFAAAIVPTAFLMWRRPHLRIA